jgi:hypothetical protein
MNASWRVALLLLCLGLGSCANAARTASSDPREGMVSIVVRNQSPEPFDVYFTDYRWTNGRLGRVEVMSRRVFYIPVGFWKGEMTLYSVPPGQTLGLVDYASTPFRLGAGRELLWVVTAARRLSDVTIR